MEISIDIIRAVNMVLGYLKGNKIKKIPLNVFIKQVEKKLGLKKSKLSSETKQKMRDDLEKKSMLIKTTSGKVYVTTEKFY